MKTFFVFYKASSSLLVKTFKNYASESHLNVCWGSGSVPGHREEYEPGWTESLACGNVETDVCQGCRNGAAGDERNCMLVLLCCQLLCPISRHQSSSGDATGFHRSPPNTTWPTRRLIKFADSLLQLNQLTAEISIILDIITHYRTLLVLMDSRQGSFLKH